MLKEVRVRTFSPQGNVFFFNVFLLEDLGMTGWAGKEFGGLGDFFIDTPPIIAL